MMSLPRALALALAQLGDPAILRVLGKTTAITLAIFLLGGVALYVGFETAIDSATSMDTGGLGALAAAASAVDGPPEGGGVDGGVGAAGGVGGAPGAPAPGGGEG